MSNINEILKKHSLLKSKLKIWVEKEIIFIEGNENGLKLLGELCLAQANPAHDCGFQIGPKVAGKIFFSKESTHGIYIHRIPCKHRKMEKDEQ